MGITNREYAYLVNPDSVSKNWPGGVFACPGVYGLKNIKNCNGKACEVCWGQEVTLDVMAEYTADGNPYYKKGESYRVLSVDTKSKSLIAKIMSKTIGKQWVGGRNFRFYLRKKEDKKLESKEGIFYKTDLKSGMVVEYRNGERRLVSGETLIGENEYSDLGNFTEELNHPIYLMDIVAVYPGILKEKHSFKEIMKNPGEPIWTREKPIVEISSEEAFRILEDKFGCRVQIKKE